jgi:ubiquinone/menaquinone biosynthesis C-methylase UbiE
VLAQLTASCGTFILSIVTLADAWEANAAALPLADGVAVTVVACMVFRDVDDLDGAAREVARVLRVG